MIDLALIFLRLKKTVAFQEMYTAENTSLGTLQILKLRLETEKNSCANC